MVSARRAPHDSRTFRVGRTAIWSSVVLASLAIMYVAITLHPGNAAYIDYVDGYYLYVAHRMAHGVRLYADVMGVQPPGIFVAGALVFRLWDNLTAIRAFSICVHLGTVAAVFLTARRLYGPGLAAILACVLYGFAPYSLYWGRLFDPNPLVTLLAVSCLGLLLGSERRDWILAGAVGGFALLTKVWFVPVGVGIIACLAFHDRRRLVPFLIGLGVASFTLCVCSVLAFGSDFWQGLLAQDVSGTSASWFEASATRVIDDDWPLLVLALVGFRALWLRTTIEQRLARYFAVCSSVVIVATVKTGTAWPVFQFAEPGLALIATGGLANLLARPGTRESTVARPRTGALAVLLISCAVLLVAYSGFQVLHGSSNWQDASVKRIANMIKTRGHANVALVAPPFYLYLADRKELGEYADVNIWALRAEGGNRQALRLSALAVSAIRARQMPIVLEDMRVARLPGVDGALRLAYVKIPFNDPLPPDRAVTIWIPGRR